VTDVPEAEAPAIDDQASVTWGNIGLGGSALFLAMPAILGGLGSLIPPLIHPDGMLPMATSFDRAVVSIFTWSVVLAMLSPPATLFAVILGAWAAKRAGWKTAFSRTLLIFVVAATLCNVTTYTVSRIAMQRHPEFNQGIPVR
jgi:hypothetical protein